MLAISIALILQSTVVVAPPPDYWGSLSPGAHAVGFSQRWVIDSTRPLVGDTTGLRFRPVLLNLWYPARVTARERMPYRDYFAGAQLAAGGRGVLRGYADALVKHHEERVREELLRGVTDSLLPAVRRELDALFSQPSAAQRDVPRIGGTLPVVVYTAGAGSSYDDNVVLCEYLASRGYLVISSAFPSEDNSGFWTRVDDDSRPRDIRRLLFELTRMPGLRTGRVVAIGHSAGAQAMQLFAADPSAPIDAVLSFDTTQDYAMPSDRSWRYYTDELMAKRVDVRKPMMFVADPSALFALADSLRNSDRSLVTVPGLRHNDFISQGLQRRRTIARAGGPAEDPRVRFTYEALVRYSAAWLDWFSAPERGDAPTPEAPLTLVRVPVGETFPNTDAQRAASGREFRHLYGSASPTEFAAAFVRGAGAQAPGATKSVLMMLLVDDIRRGEGGRARSFYTELVARDSTLISVRDLIASRAEMFEEIRATDLATEWRRILDELDGSVAPAQDSVSRLRRVEFDSAVVANRHAVTLSRGVLTGPGAELLMRAADSSRHFLMGEQHLSREIAEVEGAILQSLAGRGYQRLALEIGPYSTPVAERMVRDGTLEAFLRRPNGALAIPFLFSPEFATIVREFIRRVGGDAPVLFGFDQEFVGSGALVADLLATKARSAKERAAVAEFAHAVEREPFLVGQSDGQALRALDSAFARSNDGEAIAIIRDLIVSNRIYAPFAGRGGAIRDANETREQYIKATYLRAASSGPRRAAKIATIVGASHGMRGFSSTNVLGFGNFLEEQAAVSGEQFFNVHLDCIGGSALQPQTGGSAPCTSYFLLPGSVLRAQVASEGLTLVDLRPLRARLGRWTFLSEQERKLILAYDVYIAVANVTPATLFGDPTDGAGR